MMKNQSHWFKYLCLTGMLCLLFNFKTQAQDPNKTASTDSIEAQRAHWQKMLQEHPYKNRPYKTKKEWKKIPKKDRPDLASEHDFLMTMDPALGDVPKERLTLAHDEATTILQTKAPIAGVQWTERGPNNVGGRTRALMFDPNDATHKKVWAAGVGGGLWYTNDITAAQPTWNHVNDLWDNIAITSITYNPSNTQVFYVGTGEGFGNGGAQRGGGIWKTSDGGSTWTRLASTDPGAYNSGSHFQYVIKLVVKSNGYVFAATRGYFTNSGGIMRSTDGGSTWTRVLTHYSPGVSRDHASDIEIAANGDLYCSFGVGASGGVYKSLDANHGASGTWTNLSSNVGIANAKRIELACAPSNSSVVYAVAQGGSGDQDVEWFKKSTDGGTTWSSISIPLMVDGSGNHFTRSQAWYDLILAVHPSNDQFVIVGGIDLHRTQDGGSSWNGISHWYGGFGKPEVHADQHAISFRPGASNEMIFGNDGGVYYSTNAGNGAATPSFAHRNHGYNVTQFYACATKNEVNSNYFLAGAQDNGSQRFTQPQVNATDEVTGGDGAYCHIDQQNPNIQITQYTNNNVYRSTNGGISFPSIVSEGTGHFINPSEYDSQNKIYYAASDDDLLKRITNMDAAFVNSDIPISVGGAMISTLKMSPYNDVLFLGIENGRIYKVTNPGSATPILTRLDNGGTPITTVGWVSSIDVGANDNHLLVTYSNYGVVSVWETVNGGATWLNKEGNLPDMPIRSALYNPSNRDQVLVATEVGVWSTDNFQPGMAAAPVWGPSNTGLAHTRCDMLKYRPADKMIVVATHGRGLYTTDIFVTNTLADFTANSTYSCTGSLNVDFIDGSLKPNASWAWDINNDGVVDYTNQNPSHTYSVPGLYTVKLTVDNGSATAIKPNYILVASGAPTSATGCSLTANSNLNNAFGIGIYYFELGNIKRTTSEKDGYYNDYSCESYTLLKPNTTYTVAVQTGMANPEGARIYIDWNNNGNLETSESIASFASNMDGYRTATFTTPASGITLNTPLRMRVLSRFGNVPSNACNISTYGQAEDYTVYVVPNPSAVLSKAVAGGSSICSGEMTGLKVDITGGISPYTVKLDDGMSIQTITNYVSGTTIMVAPTTSTTYTLSSVSDAMADPVAISGSVYISVTPSTSNTTNHTACTSYTWPVNGATYLQSGNYSYVLGCHSEFLNLTILPSTSNTTTHSACDTYTWPVNGITYTQSGNYSYVNGCHTEYLNLTITPSTSNTTTHTACDTYTWSVNGTTYTQSGNYSYVNGCHTEYLNLTIVPSTSNTTTHTACDTYTWSVNGTTYTQSGNYSYVNGCHTEYLNLTIVPSTSNTTTHTACDTYTWPVNGTTYTQSGNYSYVNGCHTEYLNLTITPSSTNTSFQTSCGTYTWLVNGTTYTQTGTYTYISGCTTEILDLTITPVPVCQNGGTVNQLCGCDCPPGFTGVYCEIVNCSPTFGSSSITACDAYTWNNTNYTQTGIYTGIFPNAAGCDSTHTLNLTIVPSTSNTTAHTACDTYTWSVNGTTYTQSGNYSYVNGCHTEYLNLTIVPSTSNTTAHTACDTYTWSVNGSTYTQSGNYSYVNGCHTEYLNLTIVPSTSNTTTHTACDTYTWSVNGTTYTQSGNYSYVNGCHTEYLNLTIVPSTSNTTTHTACDTYTWSVNGTTYTQSGNYSYVNGCHTEYLNLTIVPSTSNTTTHTACDTYTWSVNGTTYTQSGNYSFVNGCHTEYLNLTIVPSTSNTTTHTACDTYTWSVNGTTYTQSGNYSYVNGCHTEYLNLTIVPSTSNTTTHTACDTYTWSVNGTTYTQSGNYSYVNGCHTEYLNLTIVPSTSNTTTHTDCDTYTWSVNGTTYTQSGNYSYVNGCHTEYLNLTIVPSTSNTTTHTACDTYTWSVNGTTYTQSGNYSYVNGCHTEYLNLTVVPSTTNTTNQTACGSYMWNVNGTTYTQSGTYSVTNGCHTEILVLSITTGGTNVTTQAACGTYTWPINNTIYTMTGTYTASSGCITEELHLTIHSLPVVTASDLSACAGQAVSLVGSPSGGSFSVSNPYLGPTTTYTYTDNNGCTATSAPATIFVSPAPPVTGINMTNIGASTATVNWNGIPGLIWYEVRYRLVGAATWTGGGTQAAPTTFKNLVGLTAGSQYEIEVRGFCTNNANAPGPWSTTQIFATSQACPTPQNLNALNVTATSATLTWTAVPNVNYYQIRYRTQAGPGAWQNGTAAGNASSKNIVGLTFNTAYDWQIRAICNPSPFSTGAWSALDDFNTLASKQEGSSEVVQLQDQIRFYPNPAQHTLNVDGLIEVSQELHVVLRDMNGRKVKVVSLWVQAGEFHLDMDIHDLSNGVYSLEISGTEWHKNLSNIMIAK